MYLNKGSSILWSVFLVLRIGLLGLPRVGDAARSVTHHAAVLHLGGDPRRQLLHLLGEAEDLELEHREFTKDVSGLLVAELLHQLSVLILLYVIQS